MLNKEIKNIKKISNVKGKHWKLSAEQNKQKSERMKGKSPHSWTEESRKKASESKLGTKQSFETKVKRGIFKKGIENPNYINDRSKLKKFDDSTKDRRSYTYFAWRKQVWERDNFKCKIDNSDCIGRLEAHHILSWKEHEKLRYDINNGITLCHFHHPKKRVDEINLSPYFTKLVTELN